MIITLEEYIDSQTDTIEPYAFPVHNKNVLKTLKGIIEDDFKYTELGYILYCPIHKNERSNYCITPMYADPKYQMQIPFHDYTCFAGGNLPDLSGMESLLESLPVGTSIITDAIGLSRDPLEFDRRFTWCNSPIAVVETFDKYLSSLERKRRYSIKRGLDNPLELRRLGPLRDQRYQYIEWLYGTYKYDHFPHALRVQLLAEAAQEAYPDMIHNFGLFRGDKQLVALVLCKTGNTWFFLTTLHDPNEDTRDLGIAALSKFLLSTYERSGSFTFDPTCQSNPFHTSHSADVYKRKFVNTDRYVPLLYMDTGDIEDAMKPPYYDGKSWNLPEKTVFIDQFELKTSP